MIQVCLFFVSFTIYNNFLSFLKTNLSYEVQCYMMLVICNKCVMREEVNFGWWFFFCCLSAIRARSLVESLVFPLSVAVVVRAIEGFEAANIILNMRMIDFLLKKTKLWQIVLFPLHLSCCHLVLIAFFLWKKCLLNNTW